MTHLASLLAQRLSDHTPRVIPGDGRPVASVAMVVTDSDLLLIQRALHPHDPWSGHLAFPGGRVDPGDASRRAAAEREAHEEVGLDLAQGVLLGRLSDQGSAGMPIIVSAFVYRLPNRLPLRPDPSEVADAHWVSLEALVEPERHTHHDFVWKEQPLTMPAIELNLGPRAPVLWGLTYGFVSQALGLVGVNLP